MVRNKLNTRLAISEENQLILNNLERLEDNLGCELGRQGILSISHKSSGSKPREIRKFCSLCTQEEIRK